MNEIARKPGLLPWAAVARPPADPAPQPLAEPGSARRARQPQRPFNALALAVRLAWRQLRADRARLATAIAGVMFACVLVFMQLGFKGALFDSATTLIRSMQADLFLIHPMTQASFRPEQFPRARAWQALADPDVTQAVPIYLAQATLRNPETGSRRSAQVIALDAGAGAVEFTGLGPLIEALQQPDTLAFDERSRPEFGPVGRYFHERGPYRIELGSRDFEVVGLVQIGPSFGADGNVVMSERNFRRLFSSRGFSNVDLVGLRLRPGADIAAVQARLGAALAGDVVVLTHPQLVAGERLYWETGTPIGFIFLFGSVMGLVVGMVIVYQILFADIAGHLSEYATLKAMGYSNGYLSRVVLGAAVILAVIGFIPGLALSLFLYDFVAKATFLPLFMPFDRTVSVLGMIFAMCFGAGLLAVRKLRDANPADMF